MLIKNFKYPTTLIILFLILLCDNSYASIFIKNSSIDLGILKYNETRKVETYIVNKSKAPLTIKNIMKSCACAKIDLSQKIIPPGQQAKVSLIVKNDSLKGKFTKKIYFVTDMKTPRFLSLTISGTAQQFYAVKPSEFIYLGTVNTDAPLQRILTITTVDKAKWGIPVISPAQSADASLSAINNNTWQLNITIKPNPKDSFFRIQITLPLITPAKIAPLKIILTGTIAKKADE